MSSAFFRGGTGDVVKNSPDEKVRNLSEKVKINYVNQNEYGENRSPCGKGLWINLWRMWKSDRYQQVFALFAWGQPVGVGVNEGVNILSNRGFACGLCPREKKETWKQSLGKKFTILLNSRF